MSDENGCKDSAEVLVTIAPEFSVMVSADTYYCFGGSAQLAASGGQSYLWSPATGLDNASAANPIANPEMTTAYEVVIKDEMGCTVKRTVEIEVKQFENFTITEAQDVCEGNTVQIEAGGGQSYNWSPATAFTNPSLAFKH